MQDDNEWFPCMTLELRRQEFELQRQQILSPEFWEEFGLGINSSLARLLSRWIEHSDSGDWQITANAVLSALRRDFTAKNRVA